MSGLSLLRASIAAMFHAPNSCRNGFSRLKRCSRCPMTAPTVNCHCYLKLNVSINQHNAGKLNLLDLDSPLVFFRLDVEPTEIVLDSRLGTSGGGGFLLFSEGTGEAN